MDEKQMSVDIIVAECNDNRGKWAACLYRARDMDHADEIILHALTGYGETPLEAAANLLVMAQRESERRGCLNKKR